MSAGKGSSPRPVNGPAYRANWETAFRNKEALKKWQANVQKVVSADLLRQKKLKSSTK